MVTIYLVFIIIISFLLGMTIEQIRKGRPTEMFSIVFGLFMLGMMAARIIRGG